MEKYIMALDQGTTSSRCILYNRRGDIISEAQKEIGQIYPKEGWVEQDGMEIWSATVSVAQEALYKVYGTYENIAAIGITNQRETTLVWDKETGMPVANAIGWQCRRTAEQCDRLKEQGHEKRIREKTGLPIDAYFSATKIQWILDYTPGARNRARKGELLFGTVDTWLIWQLSKGKTHGTDYSNAARTMLFNIHDLTWDEELCRLFDIPMEMLPQVFPSSGSFGYSHRQFFGGEIPIAGVAGDQQAALFGQTCFDKGEGKMTYGTGGFLLVNTGEKPITSKNGLLTTIAWGMDHQVYYALEGSIFVAGAAVQWLRDEMGLIESARASEPLAKSVEDTKGIYFVPAFVGLGAPHWDPYATGTITGITRGASKAHVVRATLESIAYQTRELVDAMEEDLGQAIGDFHVDGGASDNDFLMKFQGDILNKRVIKPQNCESTSLGAAYLAGLGVGYWKTQEEIIQNKSMKKLFRPTMDSVTREEKLRGWKAAVNLSKGTGANDRDSR